MTSILVIVQGLYFCITGIWPIVHNRGFLEVTGPILLGLVAIWLVIQ